MTDSGTKSRLAAAAMMLAGVASAAEPMQQATRFIAPPGTESSGAPRQATLESKTRLVKLLLVQSPAVQRIPQSNNAQARKKLADAQALYAKADTEAAAGRIEPAIKMLDEALLEIVSASRLVPDAAQLAAQERARYAGLSEASRSFLTLYKGLSERLAARKVATPSVALDVGRIQGMVEKAEALAGSGNHKDANVLLGDAYKNVVAALNKMLMAETIVYDQKFNTPAEEFQHELARNRSYEELVPLAIAQMNPSRDTALLSERYAQQSRELRDSAQKQAAGGDYPAALKIIQDATGHLQRSLRIAGVIVPQAPEGKP
jgi:hypothetical protein